MNLRDYVKVLRARWITVCVTALVAVLDALAFTLTTTPQYQASTQLFVSAPSGSKVQDLYKGNMLARERAESYSELIMGSMLAQRTVDQLNLGLTADSLRARVKAKSQLNSVLITVSVVDASPSRARDLANAVSDQFVLLAAELERPPNGIARPATRVVVQQRASVPTKAVTPNKGRDLLLGLVAGVALGVGLALVREQMDNTVKDRETLEAISGVGLVGSIPLARELRNRPAISFGGNNSSVAESFRTIRMNLQFLNVDDSPRVIVITSASPCDGKSTAAINIALALAEAEQEVVLVDGNLRRPSVDKSLELVDGGGFSDVVSGVATLPEVLQRTKFPHLTALTSGARPPNPSELHGSRRAKHVLNELRERYDFVIIDSSALLGVLDSALLAANSDGALIICSYGRTKRGHLAHAIGNLKDAGATVLGVAFTMKPARTNASGGYGNSLYSGDRRESVG